MSVGAFAAGRHQRKLRPWQQAALADYEQRLPRDYLVTATPGAGKTTFALTVAQYLRQRRLIQRIIIICPTDHLRTQWAAAAQAAGIVIDPNVTNAQGPVPDGADGYVATYAQVASKPVIHAARSRTKQTLVIFDEIHHAGDGLSWGTAVFEAFDDASRRLALTGTPFRTRPDERIPFIRYDETHHADGIALTSLADYHYSYQDALREEVVRPVVFAAYTGVSRWRNSAGEVLAASLSENSTAAVEAAAWRTALDPAGGWVPHVIAAMDERITQLRSSGMPDAAGLLLASDQDDARAYAKIVTEVTGYQPEVILSDDPKASKKIEAFRTSDSRMAVCVRMISEGVDIPRAACLGWMTNYRTPLFFAQAVGRVVRSRQPGETATVFLPAVRPLLALAAEMEQERNTVIMPPPRDDTDADAGERLEILDNADSGLNDIELVDSSAEFAHVLSAGRAVMAHTAPASVDQLRPELSDAEEDFLGLPGLLTPEQTAALLAQRDSALRRKVASRRTDAQVLAATGTEGAQSWKNSTDLRSEINHLVSRVASRNGTEHGRVHAQLRQAIPGPASAQASAELLERRRDYLLGLLY